MVNEPKKTGVARTEAGTATRGAIVATTVLLIGLFVGLAGFVGLYTGMLTCGGDGGSPYAAPASPRGQYCDAHAPAMSIVAGLALTAVGGAMAAQRRRWRPLAACAAAGAALIVSPLPIGSALPKECGDKPASMTADEFKRYLEARPECAHY